MGRQIRADNGKRKDIGEREGDNRINTRGIVTVHTDTCVLRVRGSIGQVVKPPHDFLTRETSPGERAPDPVHVLNHAIEMRARFSASRTEQIRAHTHVYTDKFSPVTVAATPPILSAVLLPDIEYRLLPETFSLVSQ